MNLLFKLLFLKSFKMALRLLGVQRIGGVGGEGVRGFLQVVKERKRSNGIYVGLIFRSFLIFIFTIPLSINCPLFHFFFFLHTVPFILLTSLVHSVLSLFPHPTFRALFLGLSNNPHITDLHLDISSCEVRAVLHRVYSPVFFADWRLRLFHHVPLLSVFHQQLRSAGAGVIQELFPRVSCVGTLDISDNGEKHTCTVTHKG